MQKNILGAWAAGLADDDYACALAALGVLEASGSHKHQPSDDASVVVAALQQEFAGGDRTPIWRRSDLSATPESWNSTSHLNAPVLATAWRQYCQAIQDASQHPRLAVPLVWRSSHKQLDLDALCAWLGHPAVGLKALVLADEPLVDSIPAWHWPLQVGVPATGSHEAILGALQAARAGGPDWVRELSECHVLGTGRDACDLLLLTQEAARALEQQPQPRMRGSFVVCLEEPQGPPASLPHAFLSLYQRLDAAGIALVGEVDIAFWFREVLRELSHDVPIHAAVYSTGRWRQGRPLPLLAGSPRPLDRCRIVAVSARQDLVAMALNERTAFRLPETEPEEPTGSVAMYEEYELGIEEGALPEAQPEVRLDAGLTERLRSKGFRSEEHDGVRAAKDLAAHSHDADMAREARWIQARAWRPDGALARALAPERWNLLGAFIGPTQLSRADEEFPEPSFLHPDTNVQITVQLELAGAAVEVPPSFQPHEVHGVPAILARLLGDKTPSFPDDGSQGVGLASTVIRLPPAGDSPLAPFAVYPQPGVEELSGRLAFIHNNRVLQTADLAVRVDADAAKGQGVTVRSRKLVHERDDDLDERRRWDVAIQVSNVGGSLHLTVEREKKGRPVLVKLGRLGGAVGGIQDALTRMVDRWDYAQPPTQIALDTALCTVAAWGSELWQELDKHCPAEIGEWGRIQVLPATDTFLPLEYVYSGEPPQPDARVCPKLSEACQLDGQCSLQGDADHICPMQFWGFQKTIERSGTAEPITVPQQPQVGVSPIPVPSKRPFGTVRSTLFAATRHAFEYLVDPVEQLAERTSLVERLRDLYRVATTDAPDWRSWWRALATGGPNLLVLLTHSAMHNGVPVLEIGDGFLLGRNQITRGCASSSRQPLLLLLLGCSTAGVTEEFHPYPERFRDAGVSIVLAPIAPIRGRDAVPLARRTAELLADRLRSPVPTGFGELLPLLRRELLLAGHPGVLGLVGFGDGDWLLGGV